MLNDEWQKVLAALDLLPSLGTEAELLRSLPRAACAGLGCAEAFVRSEVLPGDQVAVPLAPGLVLAAVGAADPAAVAAFAAMAGRLLAEVRARAELGRKNEALARRAREVEGRHRDLAARLAELSGELESSEQRQAILSERNRIAQDLHDRSAQTNFLVVLKLDWVLDHLEPDSPIRPELQRLKELAGQAAAQTREAIYALRAPELTVGGLAGGLRGLVRGLEADGLQANLTVSGVPVSLPALVEDALFKLAREATHNARKHSQGSAVMVTLRFTPLAVTLVVQDDGVGLPDDGETVAEGRFGLRGMRERVAAAGGELSLLSGDEGGLIVRATIPLEKG